MAMSPITPSELAKIPFVTNPPRDGRAMLLSPFFDATTGEWHAYIEAKPGQLVRVAGGQVVQGTYLARSPDDPGRDLEFFLGTWVSQHLSYPEVVGRFLPIKNTLQHLSACLEKYELFSAAPLEQQGPSLLAESELGHLVILVRRLYDLLQKLAKEAGAVVEDAQDVSRRLFNHLPDSFADVCLVGNAPRPASDIAQKWCLTPQLTTFYTIEAAHFLMVRAIRDAIEHHGKSPGLVLRLPEGMAVLLRETPWRNLPIWNTSNVKPNNLGSLRAVFAFLAADALDLPSRFVRSYWSSIATPPAIAEGFKCYLRGPFTRRLVSLPQVLAKPWERD